MQVLCGELKPLNKSLARLSENVKNGWKLYLSGEIIVCGHVRTILVVAPTQLSSLIDPNKTQLSKLNPIFQSVHEFDSRPQQYYF